MLSADYDGHMGKINDEIQSQTGNIMPVGVKGADPNIKMVMAGLADLDWDYTEKMLDWFDANRDPSFRKYPFHVFNYHRYSNEEYKNTLSAHGVSPEEDIFAIPDPITGNLGTPKSMKYHMIDLVNSIDNYISTHNAQAELGDREIWLTEFGYDTSPLSRQGAIPNVTLDEAIEVMDNNGAVVCVLKNLREQYSTCLLPHWNLFSPTDQAKIMSIIYETQGQWITRSLLEFSSTGFDHAFIYDIRDASEEPFCLEDSDGNCQYAGRFFYSGLLESQSEGWAEKPSWWYVSTLKNVLSGHVFLNDDQTACDPLGAPEQATNCSIQCPRIYEYGNVQDGTKVIAFWSPTSCHVQEYSYVINLPTGTTDVTVVTMQDGNASGISEGFSGITNDKIEVMVSEYPKFLILGQSVTSCAVDPVMYLIATTTSCNTVNLDWTPPSTVDCQIDHYELYYHESGTNFDPDNTSIGELTEYLYFDALGNVNEAYISGLKSGTCYYFFVVPVSEDGVASDLAYASSATFGAEELCFIDISQSMIGGLPTQYADEALSLFEYDGSTCPTCGYLKDQITFPNTWNNILTNSNITVNSFELDFGQSYELYSFFLNDGAGTGAFEVEYSTTTANNWQPYFSYTPTAQFDQWIYLSNMVASNTSIRKLKFTFVDANSRINKIMICGAPVANPTMVDGCVESPFLCNADASFEVEVCDNTAFVQSTSGASGTWDFDDGTIITGVSVYEHEYTSNGIYEISFSPTPTSDNPCHLECIEEVSIPNNTVIDASYSVQQNDCATLIQFMSNNAAWEHLWIFKTSSGTVLGQSSDINPSFNFPSDGTFLVEHTVTACPNQFATSTETIQIIPCQSQCTECTPQSGEQPIILTGNTYLSSSELMNYLNVDVIDLTGKCIEVDGTLFIDLSTFWIKGGNFSMLPNSEIRILNGIGVRFVGDIHFHGCGEMWRGIYALPGSQLTIGFPIQSSILGEDEPLIEDALYGVVANNPQKLFIRKSNFVNNFVGVVASNISHFNMDRTTFEGNGNLLPNNSTFPIDFPSGLNLPQTVGQKPYTGILASSSSSNMWSNTFTHLSNGIVLRNCDNFSIQKSQFTNMIENSSYDLNDMETDDIIDGYGIWATGTGSQFLTVYGNEGDNVWSFDDCEVGIFASEVNLNVGKNSFSSLSLGVKMTNLNTGIQVEMSDNTDINIRENYISASNNGILLNNVNQPKLDITGNYIEVGITPQTDMYGEAGINLMQVIGIDPDPTGTGNNTSYDASISENEIHVFGSTFSEGGKGVSLSNSHYLGFLDNDIRLENGAGTPFTSNGRSGFRLNNGDNLYFSCNQITSQTTDYWGQGTHFGFYIFNIQNAIYNCNRINRTTEGMRFASVCSSSDLIANEFNDHSIGLRMRPSAVLTSTYVDNNPGGLYSGTQYHYGNKWIGTTVNEGGLYEGSFDNLDLSRFVINEVATSNSCPTNPPPTDLNPCPITVIGGFPQDWFAYQPTLPSGVEIQTCDFTVGCVPTALLTPPDGGITKLDEKVKQGAYLTEVYKEEIAWELDRILLKKFGNDASLLTETTNSDYFAANNTLPVGVLENVEDDFEQLFVPSASLLAATNNSKITIHNLNNNIQNVMMQLESSTGQDSIILENELALLQNQLGSELATYKGYANQIYQNRLNQVVGIEVQNNAVSSNKIYESNEQIVNEIVALTVARGNKDFTTSQLHSLINIGRQCPLKGGIRAVYQARALARLANVVITRTEECKDKGKGSKREGYTDEENKFTINVFPNPALDDIRVTYEFYKEANRKLVIHDFIGRKIKSYPIPNLSGEIPIKTKALDAGLYWFSVYSNGHHIYTEKVIIHTE